MINLRIKHLRLKIIIYAKLAPNSVLDFQYLKKSASWLLKSIAEDYFYNQVINERTANDQHRLKYRAFFGKSIYDCIVISMSVL